MKTLTDITKEEDIKTLVDEFYKKVNNDSVLSPFFNEMSKVHWESHLPKMYDFWSSILFGTMKYHGLPFPKHQVLPMEVKHFDRWIHHFNTTIDEFFTGPKAEEAKTRAGQIAKTFQFKLGILK